MRYHILALAAALALATCSEAHAFYPVRPNYAAMYYARARELYEYQLFCNYQLQRDEALHYNGITNPSAPTNPLTYIPPRPYGKTSYPVPPGLQYLKVGTVVNGPHHRNGAFFDLEVVKFQGRKVFVPVTGADGGCGGGGGGSGD